MTTARELARLEPPPPIDYAYATRRRTLANLIADDLGYRIVSGQYGEGEVLDLPGLERQFAVSRNSMRECLIALTSKGLILSTPNTGTVVRPPSHWHLLDADVVRWMQLSNTLTESGRDFLQFLDTDPWVTESLAGGNMLVVHLVRLLKGLTGQGVVSGVE
jgi:DNA-binding GntR family transcriptional regulator